MKEMPQRKRNRLLGYDYSQNGAYFITICIKDKHEILGKIVGANDARPHDPPSLVPSDIGLLVIKDTENLATIYPYVTLDCYIVMPNHVHMIIVIDSDGRAEFAPTVSRMIKQWKGVITKKIGFSPWQKSFHDHIIRNTQDYVRIHQYIQNNPAQWEQDCFNPASENVKK
jgi:putative transposase